MTLARADRRVHEDEVRIHSGAVTLLGTRVTPDDPLGVVIVATGDVDLARRLASLGLAAVAIELLDPAEERLPELRNDVGRLAARLGQVTAWVERQVGTHDLPIGLLASGAGAAAALVAAAFLGDRVRAVVALDGRIDLAAPFLGNVSAPTLLLVEGEGTAMQVSVQARRLLAGPSELVSVSEPGAVSKLSVDWLGHLLAA